MKYGLNKLIVAGLLLAATFPLISEGTPMTQKFQITSSAYKEHDEMPARFTSDGPDISPPLAWSDAPAGTRSFALIMDDPDAPDPAAPKMTWVHWVLYDIPANAHALPEGGSKHLPTGAREGVNDWKRTGYGGPNPPIGRHRYFVKLYALDTLLPNLHKPTKTQLEAAMRGHILAETQLIGTYQHPK